MRALVAICILGLALPVYAQNPAPAPTVAPSDVNLEEAKKLFQKGVELYEAQSYAPALAALEGSHALAPRKNSTKLIAFCLRKLGREDDALQVFEEVLSKYEKEIDSKEKQELQKDIETLRAQVGSIEITGAELGATITIDNRLKGEYPQISRMRLMPGSHRLSVYKKDFMPFEVVVVIDAGKPQITAVKLQPLRESGQLRVVEQSGRNVDVYLDGAIVGQTPWEGPVAIGKHVVRLVGPGITGTQPYSVSVASDSPKLMTLEAKELVAEIHVKPTPLDAAVMIDGVDVGIGPWSGRLAQGEHQVNVYKAGFVTESRSISLEPGSHPDIKVSLAVDSAAVFAAIPSVWTAELSSGFSVSSFGGDVFSSGACGSQCIGLGTWSRGLVAYEYHSRWGFGIEGGYWSTWQDVKGRPVRLTPIGFSSQTGKADDHVQIRGPFVGANVSGHWFSGKWLSYGARIGAGTVLANVYDVRSAKGFSTLPSETLIQAAAPVKVSHPVIFSPYIYGSFELFGGVRITEKFEIGMSVLGFVAVALREPRFDAKLPVNTNVGLTAPLDTSPQEPRQTYATFDPETITSRIVPSGILAIRARYAW